MGLVAADAAIIKSEVAVWIHMIELIRSHVRKAMT